MTLLHNYADPAHCPLVTVQLMAHDGDAKFLKRSIASIMKQTLDHEQIHLQIVFDGPPLPASDKLIVEATHDVDFTCFMLATTTKHGYYCGPRNMALPSMLGLYVAHMDADNEWKPEHLEKCLQELRTWTEEDGYPDFVYAGREYVIDDTVPEKLRETLVVGPAEIVPWTPESRTKLIKAPQYNFVDTGDFVISKSALMWIAHQTGYVWNTEMRRFGDWELMCRAIGTGLTGRPLEAHTHIYHWQGENLQITRSRSEMGVLPLDVYERLKEEGKIRE